jgi:aspartyl-tRNA(Asn)/glutamyl-tRNA(Gln) amidotransferase subunit C
MKLDKKQLQKIAANARLELSNKEIDEFLPQLQEVLDLFSVLDRINTDKVKPSFQPIQIEDVMREDKIKDCLTKEEVFFSVKNKQDSFFKGPKAV